MLCGLFNRTKVVDSLPEVEVLLYSTFHSVSRVCEFQVTWSNTHAWALRWRTASSRFRRYHWLPAFSQSRGLFFECAWQSSPSLSGTIRFMDPRLNRGGFGSRILTITTFITRSTSCCIRNRFVQVWTLGFWCSCASFLILTTLHQIWRGRQNSRKHESSKGNSQVKKKGGSRWKFWKELLRGVMILFCDSSWIFFTPRSYQFKNNTLTDTFSSDKDSFDCQISRVIFFRLSALKGIIKALAVELWRLNSLRGTYRKWSNKRRGRLFSFKVPRGAFKRERRLF